MSTDCWLVRLPAELQLQIAEHLIYFGTRELCNLRRTCRTFAVLGAKMFADIAIASDAQSLGDRLVKYDFSDQSLQVMEAVLRNPYFNPIITGIRVVFSVGEFIAGADGYFTNFLSFDSNGPVDTPLEGLVVDDVPEPTENESQQVNGHPFFAFLRDTKIPRHNNKAVNCDLVKRRKRIMSEHLQTECATQRHRQRLGEILDLGTRLTTIQTSSSRRLESAEKASPFRPQWRGLFALVDIASQGSRFSNMSLWIKAFEPTPDEEDADLVDLACRAVAQVQILTIDHNATPSGEFWSSVVLAAASTLKSLTLISRNCDHVSQLSQYAIVSPWRRSHVGYPHLVELYIEDVSMSNELLMQILKTARESLRTVKLLRIDAYWEDGAWDNMHDYVEENLDLEDFEAMIDMN